MKLFSGLLFSALVLSMVACGGVSDDTKLSELADGDADEVCADITEETKDCSGVTITRKGGADCAAGLKSIPDSCTATVGDFNDCNDGDVCETTSNAGCGKIFQCAVSQ